MENVSSYLELLFFFAKYITDEAKWAEWWAKIDVDIWG
jgi:hypothetical protein